MPLISVIMIVAGLAVMVFGVRRISVRNSKGNFANNTSGNVTQTYTETSGTAPPASGKSFEGRFLAWGGFLVALAGLVVAIIPLVKH